MERTFWKSYVIEACLYSLQLRVLDEYLDLQNDWKSNRKGSLNVCEQNQLIVIHITETVRTSKENKKYQTNSEPHQQMARVVCNI